VLVKLVIRDTYEIDNRVRTMQGGSRGGGVIRVPGSDFGQIILSEGFGEGRAIAAHDSVGRGLPVQRVGYASAGCACCA
jgi:hypothetical protein